MRKYTELQMKLAGVEFDLETMTSDRDFWKSRASEQAAEITRLGVKLANQPPEKQKQTYLEKAVMALSAGHITITLEDKGKDVIALAERIEKYETERAAKLERKARKAAIKRESARAMAKAEFDLHGPEDLKFDLNMRYGKFASYIG